MIRLLVFIAVSLFLTTNLIAADPPKVQKTTYTYKQVGDLEIKLDVHRPAGEGKRPVAVWIHGGALIMGHREGISQRVAQSLLEAGFVVVSIDYRLAPETKLPEIIADVEDAFAWIRKQGPKKFAADPSRIAVLGGSAGGYLTMMTGHRVKPRPNVLVAFWGYGDLVGPWYSQPSPHPRHQGSKISDAEAAEYFELPPISDSRVRKLNGGAFYQYCRQRGLWPKYISGWDPVADVKKYQPYMPLVNVTGEYPPILMIHGTADTDVPYEQSKLMAAALAKRNVEHRLISIEKGEHGLGGGDPEKINAAYEAVVPFINEHLKQARNNGQDAR